MKTIFITGATGLLGTNLILELLAHEFNIKALLRNPSRFVLPPHRNLELIQGSLFDDLTQIISNCDVVIHVAAETRQDLSRYEEYHKINCNATVQLFNTARLCNVKKFVFVSTANTIGFGSADVGGTEQDPITYPFSGSNYAKSKQEAEDYLLANKEAIEVMIINPTFMLGEHDTKPSSGKIILMGWKKKILFYPPGGKNFVHVKDVAKGIISSLVNGKNGERYLLANENLTYYEFFKRLNRLTNQNPLMIKVPRAVLIFTGFIGDLLKQAGFKTSLNSTNMRILCIHNFYSNQKSRRELEIEYTSCDEAIMDSVRYFQHKGLIR
ncbi:MAG TPA: NAD-dependent epimerase/dehydratase family protein [Bacteroidales bacterium]|nr:NAD-dependent epimerase/dehydratase family protein [Bacteroidales bacterium]